MPPKYTAHEEAKLEQLAGSFTANVMCLEGHSVRSRDLKHIIRERGTGKAVIDHLMTLGKIDRQGDFIVVISLLERIRRGL